jgi:hypothetical protein
MEAVSHRWMMLGLLQRRQRIESHLGLHAGQFDGRLIELGDRFPREWMEIGRELQGFPFDAEEIFKRSKCLKTP